MVHRLGAPPEPVEDVGENGRRQCREARELVIPGEQGL
jgi:hypothetical protein